MLDHRFIRENLELVRGALARRGSTLNLDDFTALEERRRACLAEVESLKAERNRQSKLIVEMMRRGEDVEALKKEVGSLGPRIKEGEENARRAQAELDSLLERIENIPHESVPGGRDDSDNRLERVWGEKPSFSFAHRDHAELGEALGIFDFARGAKLAGSRFTLLRGPGARLERALISFMLDVHTREHGYREYLPPFINNRECFFGVGQLPKFEDGLFKALRGGDEDPDLARFFLIPTAEVPLTNIHREEILPEEVLPLYYTAYTPCFRSEAGAAGQDTHGYLRQHQFNKVELVKVVRPDTSYEELETLTRQAETILQRLELHYRVVTLCTGDIGFSAAKTYDLEVWLPGQDRYREISSCSNFEAFQARRANIRYRPEGGGKPEFVHTLNGSGVAVGRTLIALLEQHQQADGTVAIPSALRPYMGGMERVEPIDDYR